MLTLTRKTFRAMGSDCSIAIVSAPGEEPRVRSLIGMARSEIDACERIFTRFDAGSDLSRVNAASGGWVVVDRRLIELTLAALSARDVAGGCFDPTILPALVAAGYDTTLDRIDHSRPPRDVEWEAGEGVEVDVAGCRIRLRPGVQLDMGGIAKGWSADRVLLLIRRSWLSVPGAIVNLGGDMALWGAPPEGGSWRVAVTDPADHARTLSMLNVGSAGIATSGRDRRRFGPGRRSHHLIDPRTGRPAADGPLAVTVVAESAHTAEIHATVLAMSGPEASRAYLRSRPSVGALAAFGNGGVVPLGRLVPSPRGASSDRREASAGDALAGERLVTATQVG